MEPSCRGKFQRHLAGPPQLPRPRSSIAVLQHSTQRDSIPTMCGRAVPIFVLCHTSTGDAELAGLLAPGIIESQRLGLAGVIVLCEV